MPLKFRVRIMPEKHQIAFDMIKDRWLLDCFAIPKGGGYQWLGFVVDLADADVDLPLEARTSYMPHPETAIGWGSSFESAKEMGLFWFQFTKERLLKSGE